MICSSTNNSHTDPVPLIPASVAIDDIYTVAGVQVIDSPFSVDPPDLALDCQKGGLKSHVTRG